MKCSGTWGPLYLHIPDHYPGSASAQALQKYREEFHIPDDLHLAADWHRQRLSQGQSRRMNGPDGEKIREHLAQKSARPHPERYGKTGLNPSGKVIPSWGIAKRLTQGKGLVETMDELGAPNHKLIQRRAAALGLAFGTAFLCDQGEPFRYDSLSHLRKASGFEAEDFDKYVGLSVGRSGSQRPEVILNPKEARKAMRWRDEVTTALLAVPALHVAGKDYRKDDVLRTFLPELLDVNRSLMLTISEIRKAAREHPEWGVAELCGSICEGAQREQSVNSGDNRWRKTLRYLWQAEEWIAKNLGRLRGSEHDGPLIREMIGARYGATHQAVQNALRDRTETIARMEMRMIVMTFAPTFAEARKEPGSPTGPRPATRETIPKLAALRFLDYSQPQMVSFLYPGQYRGSKDFEEAGRVRVKNLLMRNKIAIKRELRRMTRERALDILGLTPN
jgi:hypothetical protein